MKNSDLSQVPVTKGLCYFKLHCIKDPVQGILRQSKNCNVQL